MTDVVGSTAPAKNKTRLGRIFRSVPAKKKVAPRAWFTPKVVQDASVAKEGKTQVFTGVDNVVVTTLINGLNADEIKKALAGQEPPSQAELIAANRAARFGSGADNGTSAVDASKAAARMSRFGGIPDAAGLVPPVETADVSEAQKKRMEKFGAIQSNGTMLPMVDSAKAEARAARFA